MAMSATKIAVPPEQRDTVREAADMLSRVASGSGGGILVRDASGREVELALSAATAGTLATVLERLGEGEGLVVLGEEDELTPEQAATVLGISRPVVYHRMDTDRLPYRQVGTHRRVNLKDVLALQASENERRRLSRALAEDTDDQDLASRGP
ncbi:MAG: helix-turn-helix domain-containing protein [Salinarimonas sp.]